MIPDPKIPANPVPDPKYPTTVLGKPLQYPRAVLSPKAQEMPMIIEDSRESQNEAMLVLYLQHKATMSNPIMIATVLMVILTM